MHSRATHDTPCCPLCVVWHRLSARVCVCLCCAVARSCVQRCVAVLLRAGATDKSRDLSLSGSALSLPKGVTCIETRGKNSHRFSPCESRARGPERFALTRVVLLEGRTADVCQVSACVPMRGSRSPQAACPQALLCARGTLPGWSVVACTHATSRSPHRRSSPVSKGLHIPVRL